MLSLARVKPVALKGMSPGFCISFNQHSQLLPIRHFNTGMSGTTMPSCR